MKKNIGLLSLLAALAVILVIGAVAQQTSGDTAIDPVCGMTVVKANARATYDYKGTTYYFCNPGCKDSFVKDPEKYIQAMAKGEKPAAGMGMMRRGQAMGQGMGMGQGMAGCPMMQGGQMGQGMMGRGMLPRLMSLYGDKIEIAVENTKDGAMLKVTSTDPEVVKAIQVHMAEHMTMMKKMKEGAAKASMGMDKMAESGCCADCPMMKK